MLMNRSTFFGTYLQALAQKKPKLYQDMKGKGKLMPFLKEQTDEAQAIYAEVLSNLQQKHQQTNNKALESAAFEVTLDEMMRRGPLEEPTDQKI